MKVKIHSALLVLLLIVTPLSHAVQDLPANVVDFASSAGQQSLESALKSPYSSNTLKLLSHFTTQKNTTYCGVASMVTVLNSSNLEKPDDPLHKGYKYFTQENFFNSKVSNILPSSTVSKKGITLDELAKLASEGFGLNAQAHHANEYASSDRFKDALIDAMAKNDFVIVNFSRKALNQEGGGHHTPIAAYDEKTDRFLLLDVARYKYGSYWVSSHDLWTAVNTRDKGADAMRGILVISNQPKPTQDSTTRN